MHLSRHNKVTIAFRRPDTNENNQRILRWDSTSSTALDFDYYSNLKGKIGALFVVEDASEANQHTFAGGSFSSDGGIPYNRVPTIFHFKDTTPQTHKLLNDASIDSECRVVMIDHLKLDTDTNYLFGTTRCTNKDAE